MKKLITLGLFLAGSVSAQTANIIDLSASPEQQRVDSLEQMLVQKGKTILDMQQHIDALQQELNELRGLNETNEYRLNQIMQRQRELYQEFDKLLTKVSSVETHVKSEAQTVSGIPIDTSLSESSAYEQALSLALKNKQFDQAIVKFKQYQTNFPNSSYTANVHYWLGQLLFNKGNKAAAKVEFDALVTNFPESAKRGDALVKLGKIAHDANQIDVARNLYLQVINEYADTASAQIAKTRLSNLR